MPAANKLESSRDLIVEGTSILDPIDEFRKSFGALTNSTVVQTFLSNVCKEEGWRI
jgi:hypothetical protein